MHGAGFEFGCGQSFNSCRLLGEGRMHSCNNRDGYEFAMAAEEATTAGQAASSGSTRDNQL